MLGCDGDPLRNRKFNYYVEESKSIDRLGLKAASNKYIEFTRFGPETFASFFAP